MSYIVITLQIENSTYFRKLGMIGLIGKLLLQTISKVRKMCKTLQIFNRYYTYVHMCKHANILICT